MTIMLEPVSQAPSSSSWLYNRHFGLGCAPFSLTPDTRFFYAHESCRIALNTLTVAIQSGEGFTKITGEVGTGKTVLCRKLLSVLRNHYTLAYIPNPFMDPQTLLCAIADELGMEYPENITQHQLVRRLGMFIIDSYAGNRRPIVICLDDAHSMPVESLEALRVLSNIETQQRKLIQLVLFGQAELDQTLNLPECRQLKQRISFSYFLTPLQRKDVRRYIDHRLQIAGYRGKPLFTIPAIWRLSRASGGLLRVINILTHKAMMSAYGTGDHRISTYHVKRAIADTDAMVMANTRDKQRFSWFSSKT